MHLRLVYLPEEQLTILQIDMPPLPPNRLYQAWQIIPSGPRNLGPVSQGGYAVVSADLSQATAIAISIEPQGGGPAPTTMPMLVAEF